MTDKEREDFSNFGKTFQEDLCHLILADRPFADQIFEVFDTNFLELKHLRVFVKKISNYRKKYGVHPTEKIMKSIIRTELKREPESIQVLIRDYYARVLSSGLEPEGSEYIKDVSLDFCRKQKLKEAMIESGYSVAPFDAHPDIKKLADFITKSNGGDGVIREIADHLFE